MKEKKNAFALTAWVQTCVEACIMHIDWGQALASRVKNCACFPVEKHFAESLHEKVCILVVCHIIGYVNVVKLHVFCYPCKKYICAINSNITLTISERYLVNVAKLWFVSTASMFKCLEKHVIKQCKCMGKCVIKITCYVKYSANLLITFAVQCKYGITGLPCIYMSFNRPAKCVFFSSSDS